MSTLADFTQQSSILSRLSTSRSHGVVAELCAVLERQGRAGKVSQIYEAVIARESLCSTAMMPGWALAHARLPGIDQVILAVGRSPEPLEWFGNTTVPVRLIFLFLVPDNDTGTYLQIVAALARLSRNPRATARLLNAADAAEILHLLREIPLIPPGGPARACAAPIATRISLL